MRRRLFIIFCLFIITGCKNKDRIPAGILPQKKMQAIVWDMMRADQFLTDYVLNKDTSLDKRMQRIKLYSKVFSIHQVSKEQYEESFSYYKSHPALFKILMDSLSHPKAEAPTEMINPPMPRDSFQQPIPKTPKGDSITPFRKRKGRNLIKEV